MIETGFPPLARPDARILVLGSMPGRRSLDEARYYAHPRNLFWPFMARVAGFDPGLGHEARVEALLRAGVALWDVLAACERPGSLDTAIRRASERPNAIGELLHAHPGITLVACNGGKALQLFQRHVRPTLADALKARIEILGLPSTSPANASIPLAERERAWMRLSSYLR
ncbi:DNA-deoxyinosine glycosylase [Alkalisalibacterium limincola]|uniref:DNA-deoxyinosine glycosylase n=1 Tax=Alkalisalibacterium limincola TaxID=2699169 RepID=A0A5C8KWD2_9GAMM|nr:DNA-deoxyinosine glycosylase [Alkalisalibacterium limincola]TXK64930.1 DNA-deoxyinosine glycosylase [Alkalisalibacterium limincola]